MKKLALVLGLLASTVTVWADTYSTFKTTRYYSDNKRFSVEVTPKRRATLYRGGRRVWSRTLPQLPGKLLVTSDGKRVVVVDRYYGNNSFPATPAVIIFDERGNELARHRLGEVANLSRVLSTTSTARWYKGAHLTPNGRSFIVETLIAKRDPATCKDVSSIEEADECSTSVPYEQLRFTTATGELTSRIYVGRDVNASRR